MPVTGNMDQDNPIQESVELTTVTESDHVIDGQTSFNDGAEVSSTTTDADAVSEKSQIPIHGDISEHVQSTSMEASSDSLDGFKVRAPSFDESTSKPSSSSGSVNLNKGFQDAFAAFASASYREPEEDSPMDTCTDTSNITSEAGPEALVSTVSNLSAVDSLVSSAIDSGQITTTTESLATSGGDVEYAQNVITDTVGDISQGQAASSPVQDPEHSQLGDQVEQVQYSESSQPENSATSDSVYFIQMTDASGQVVTSIIDPNDIPSYTDSVVYKQCMRPDGEIETTIVYSAGTAVSHEEQPQEQVIPASEETEPQQGEQQVIYAHDINGHLTPIDSAQSFNDVAPPGKQFVYMQDSTGRIIRTVMDADQTMVPGQQVYYTQSDDGRIITSVMDPSTAGVPEETVQGQQPQEDVDQMYQQQMDEAGMSAQQQEAGTSVVGGTSSFNIDNSMSGLSMLAELSHLTAGQAFNVSGLATEQRTASNAESSYVDQDEFSGVTMMTREAAGDEGLESVSSEIAELKVGETDSDIIDESPSPIEGDGTGQEETLITKIAPQMDEQIQASLTSVSRDNLFVQWQNLDSMCWMDVILIMLVNSPTLRPLVNLDPSHELASTLLITLLKANRQAQILLQNILKKSNGAEISSLQTGAGNSASIQDPKTAKLVCKENMDEIGKAINILYAMREKIWQALQPRLRCERGKHNSPVLVLPLLVREKPAIKQLFTMNYRYMFKCEQCSYSQDDSHTKILPSIPAVPDDFNMQAPCFVRNCFECQAPNQRMLMKFEVLHDFVQMHFVKGLPHNRFEELSFDFNGDHYEVTAVVHYKNSPDHFIAWVRNAPGPAWMECDDLKSVITCYSNVPPNIPPSQVHMVLWERRLTPQHTLVMRDTEDTKLLASLVLTVQQPNMHQTTEQAAKPVGVPSASATTAASPVTSAVQTANTQTGVMTQTFSYTPRPRGRGRGSRGSYGSRGQALPITTPVIRRVSPAVTQLPSPSNSLSQNSQQVIRLPLSAFASSGLNLRGSTSGGTRLVLLGNNSQTGTISNTTQARSSAASKVVVVRSQGGAANISAAQLLQLLQRTGAISQAGTRITTTVTTSGASSNGTSAASTTSYIIQQDGTIVTAPNNPEIPASTSLLDSSNEQIAEGATGTEYVDTQQNDQLKASASQKITTLPYLGPTITTLGQASGSDTIIQSPEQVSLTSSASQGDLSSVSSGYTEVTGDQQNVTGQTVNFTQSQQPTRYIQVPNPAGGGTLLCQLGMRDGKMILVPVDKNIQSQATGTSILKLTTTPTTSPKITIRVPTTSPQVTAASSEALLAQLKLQAQNASTSAAAGPRLITLPGISGNKRIQLITVPRGVNTTQTNQSGLKTIIMNQQAAVTTTPSVITRLVSPGETSSDSSILSQSGDPMATSTTQTVSVFKDIPVRTATTSLGTSLLTSPSKQLKAQENFRYILPGSNTTHVLHTNTSGMQGGLGPAGRAFTALSSSGTIIGGQLTPSSATASVETSVMEQDLAAGILEDGSRGTNVLTPRRQLSREIDTTEYIPLGRSHSRGRGGPRGGRGRTPRGRGRSRLWTTDAEFTAPLNSRKISTLADLRQIGAHVIEAGSETVDGVPVVSIPDFASDGAGHNEILSAAQSIISESTTDTAGLSDTSSQLVLPGVEQENQTDSEDISALQGPRVITQPIPSVRANHGFDILTQGILGNAARTAPRQARSLLTGAATTLHTASSLLSSLTETALTSLSTTASSSLESATHTVQQAIGQAEIDTLIQAAQAAAKPTIARSQASVVDAGSKSISDIQEMTSHLVDTDFGKDDATKDDIENDKDMNVSEEGIEVAQGMTTQLQHEEDKEQDGTVVSIDDSQVSAAERYRMPVELFQPDEEFLEKPLKSDDSANKLAADLPSKLFEDSEMNPVGDEFIKSPWHQSKGAVKVAVKKRKWGNASVKKNPVTDNSKDIFMKPGREEDSMEIESTNAENSVIDPSIDDSSEEVKLSTKTESSAEAIKEDNRDADSEMDKLSSDVENSTVNTVDIKPVDGLTADVMLTAKEELASAKDVPVKKVGRPRGRPKGSKASKQGGKRKTKSIGTSQVSDTVHMSSPVTSSDIVAVPLVTPESSPDRKATHITTSPETQSLQHSPCSIAAKYSTADVSAASDMLLMTSDAEIEQEAEKTNSSTEVVQEDGQDEEILLKEQEQTLNIDKNQEQTLNIDKNQELEVKEHIVFSPAIGCHKKENVNWDNDAEVLIQPESRFNYKVLTCRQLKSRHRHPSLGPVQESFISVPTYLPTKLPRSCDTPQKFSAATVTHHNPRPLQKPKTDPAKDPTVIPLVVEDNCDPACMAGSVVTSPNGGEIFTGVSVRHKRETADWSTSVDDEVEDVTENVTEEELKTFQMEYRRQLMTVLYMQAGDISAVIGDISDDDSLEVDEKMNANENVVEEKIVEQDKVATEEKPDETVNEPGVILPVDIVQTGKTVGLKGKQKKRKQRMELAALSLPKKARSSQDEESDNFMQSPSQSAYSSEIDSSDASSAAALSRVNGIDSVSSPAHLSQTTSDSDVVQTQSKGKLTAPQISLHSPSRRSSRTPVPSKKVLDAWEDYPVRSALKDKRAFSQSSDDELMGYGSGDKQRKKQKTKQTVTPT